MPIPIYTCIYMHIPIKYTVGGRPYTYCSIIPTRYKPIPTDTCIYNYIPTPQIIPTEYLLIHAKPDNTYRADTYGYVC